MTTASSIPLLDLRQANETTTRPKLLQSLRSALLNVGFLYVSGHEVSRNIVDDLVAIMPELFSLPAEEKERMSLINSPCFSGYGKFGSETTAGVRDEREQFEFANELPDEYDPQDPLWNKMYGPNQWPSSLPHVQVIVQRYIAGLTSLAESFLLLAAEALDLPPRTFLPFVSKQHRIKLSHYRPVPDGSSQGVGPHKDSSGWITFLLQASNSSIKGLQALSKTGEWIDVPAIPDTFVVNMGQVFEVVTNGVCKATTHRVLLPQGDYNRYSVPFFQGVRLDLTKEESKLLWDHFDPDKWQTEESEEGQMIDSAFLRGKYNTWGETQLRTKIRSHKDVGMRHYSEVFDKYVNEDVADGTREQNGFQKPARVSESRLETINKLASAEVTQSDPSDAYYDQGPNFEAAHALNLITTFRQAPGHPVVVKTKKPQQKCEFTASVLKEL